MLDQLRARQDSVAPQGADEVANSGSHPSRSLSLPRLVMTPVSVTARSGKGTPTNPRTRLKPAASSTSSTAPGATRPRPPANDDHARLRAPTARGAGGLRGAYSRSPIREPRPRGAQDRRRGAVHAAAGLGLPQLVAQPWHHHPRAAALLAAVIRAGLTLFVEPPVTDDAGELETRRRAWPPDSLGSSSSTSRRGANPLSPPSARSKDSNLRATPQEAIGAPNARHSRHGIALAASELQARRGCRCLQASSGCTRFVPRVAGACRLAPDAQARSVVRSLSWMTAALPSERGAAAGPRRQVDHGR
jgi:hypothetical protein